MIDIFSNNRFSVILSSRQSGKCVRGNTEIELKNRFTEKEYKTTIKEFVDMIENVKENSIEEDIDIDNMVLKELEKEKCARVSLLE